MILLRVECDAPRCGAVLTVLMDPVTISGNQYVAAGFGTRGDVSLDVDVSLESWVIVGGGTIHERGDLPRTFCAAHAGTA